jgi:DNA-binding CsgD family transcriptional regulator
MAEFGEPLSSRESEVLELLATGATNRQIAQELVVSVNTVKVHVRNIFTKLGVESRTEATLIAIREGLIDVPLPEEENQASEEEVDEEETLSAEPLPPLPWPKRVALVLSLLLVATVTAVTWPRSQTSAGEPSDETDTLVTQNGNAGVLEEDTGWRAVAPMTVARSRFALVGLPDGGLCAIGGETSGGITGSAECYDPTTDQWNALPTSKPTRVSNIAAAAISDRIYVPGGFTPEGQPTAVVEAYNLREQTWSEVASLPRPVSSYALTTYGGRIYLFGGKDDRGSIGATYIYDPAQDLWSEGKAMLTRRAYTAAATLGSRIYVIGGYDGQREQATCEAYRPDQDTWESCNAPTLARGGFGLAGVADRLYTVGGGWSNYLWFNEKYNPASGEWTPFETPLSRQWLNLAVASQPDKFYAAGGWNGDYLNGVWEYLVLRYKIFVPATP